VHPVVRSLASGTHYGSGDFPLVPGVDAVARDHEGTLVFTGGVVAPYGTMAERLSTPFALPLPTGADPCAVAAGMNPATSGWMPLILHREARGELGTVLVLGATGLAGSLAVRSALRLGARTVIATGRNPEALNSLRSAGADVVRLPVGETAGARAGAAAVAAADVLRAVVERAGTAPDLVLDYVWGPVAEATFAALGRTGMAEDSRSIRYVQIGEAAGATAALPASLLRSRKIEVVGSGAGSFDMQRLMAETTTVLGLIADGTLPVPYRTFSFSDAEAAWAYTGPERAVLAPDPTWASGPAQGDPVQEVLDGTIPEVPGVIAGPQA
jgi:NADPH:quinone reductase-like Zn-dependent oxidoreductase